ncbi:transcriptional regulator [Rhizocola hellebori]|uniref:Transcriptional regulator n=1 Tax=Rhizocola hellebori TaxID=1392758 RepID=A0A8J3Q425_9ACTN|nr:GAF and ANTAR domain-containing protein [Rhizocola hellebori]GIH03107.1 transcriptional regulator [Rhizocola hellebori]
MTTISAEGVARTFVEFADTLIDEFDLIEFLQRLADRIAELLEGTSVGLLLTNHDGRLQFMAASSETLRLLELFQIQEQEGPCMDAFRTHCAVVNADLAAATDRWPEFAPRAVAAGFHSVHAFPLRLRQDTIGALNVFTGAAGARLSDAEVQIVQALADIAAIGLLQERAISRSEILVEQLQSALNSRIVIEQAKGVLAHARGISPHEAFELIRSYARSRNLHLTHVAHAVIEDLPSMPELANK